MKTARAGGQAVIEGVMMRVGERVAVAVRSPDGSVMVKRETMIPLATRYPLLAWPVLRGSAALVESLSVGVRALMFSANAQAETPQEELSSGDMIGAVGLAVVCAVVLFILLPTVLASLAGRFVLQGLFLNLVEGVIRLAVVVAYIAAIGLMPDITRVYQYHGAEHKVIRAWEIEGSPVTAERARPQPISHVRCGTSFILMVAVISIVLFSLFGWPSIIGRIAIRLLMLPVVAGIAYELILLASRSENPGLRLIVLPGVLMQRLTTREPDDEQLEVAITALHECLEAVHNG